MWSFDLYQKSAKVIQGRKIFSINSVRTIDNPYVHKSEAQDKPHLLLKK